MEPPSSRNAPCPCGSGKRFKECHGGLPGAGAFAAQPSPGGASDYRRLQDAQRRLDAADIDGAESLCHEILAASPDHLAALRILALCHYERGFPGLGLRELLRAARSLPAHFASAQEQY